MENSNMINNFVLEIMGQTKATKRGRAEQSAIRHNMIAEKCSMFTLEQIKRRIHIRQPRIGRDTAIGNWIQIFNKTSSAERQIDTIKERDEASVDELLSSLELNQ